MIKGLNITIREHTYSEVVDFDGTVDNVPCFDFILYSGTIPIMYSARYYATEAKARKSADRLVANVRTGTLYLRVNKTLRKTNQIIWEPECGDRR